MRVPVPIPPEGIYIILKRAFTGIKGIPLLSVGNNDIWQKLRLFEDFIETTVILPSRSHISEIESVELDTTLFGDFCIRVNWQDSWLTFDCIPQDEEDTLDVLRYFQRRGIQLKGQAQHIIDVNRDR